MSSRPPPSERKLRVLTIFGTRPEIIKLAPVIAELQRWPKKFQAINVSSGQHRDLIIPFLELFALSVDHDLAVMRAGQPLNKLLARIVDECDTLFQNENPDVVLVQGDTTTALGAAMAAFQRKIPVGHVEAGLRTNDPLSPFPEEMNRRLITRMATLHFAATKNHRRTLRREGISPATIFLTGNPVVDALLGLGDRGVISAGLKQALEATKNLKRITLTTHRRESFDGVLEGNLQVLRDFLEQHEDVALIFPIHPNPVVREAAKILSTTSRVHLLDPLEYPDFIHLLKNSWLITSDSGGVQEEAPSLGVPLLVLRESTERPEVLQTGIAKLAPTPRSLALLLAEAYERNAKPMTVANPFGDGQAARRIVKALARTLVPPFATEEPQ